MLKQAAAKMALLLGSLIVAAGLVLQPSPSEARVFVGVGVGVPLFVPGPWYYPPAYYPPPPVVYAPPVYAPVVQPTYVAPPAQSWYYCDNPKGYYPSVSTCSSGWRQIPAQPH